MSIPVALVVAAGAATGRPLGRVDVARRDELVILARKIPEPDRPGVLSVAECLFARLDPAWAWAQIDRLTERPEIVDVRTSVVYEHLQKTQITPNV